LVLSISRADAALSELSGLGTLLPNPHVLISSLIRREAVQSSRIEGTQASLSDVLLDEAAPTPTAKPQKAADLQGIHNYVIALEHGIARLAKFPLSLRLVREIHAKLMNGVRGSHATPGEFRRSQNWIGPAGTNPTNAPYVPPPPEEMDEALCEWEKYLHQRDQLPDLIQCALLHEQFEAIHPFLDGNGRVGRLLITLFLIERGRLCQPLLYLSDFIERNRSDYYDLLQRVRTRGEWTPWIRYFLAGVEHTAKDAAIRTRRLLALRESLLRETKGAAPLVDQLLSNPYITIPTASKVLGVSTPTATKLIRELESKKLLKETTGRSWGKVYLAPGVLAALERPDAK
jgi:Fic family protein